MKVTSKPVVDWPQTYSVIWEIQKCFNLLLPLVNDRPKDEDDQIRTGGYFRFWQRLEEAGRFFEVAAFSVGELGSRLPVYIRYSLEKAQRLSELPGHVSSWQSRNVAADMYGGAIRCGPFILSFSGLPEKWDEVLMLLVARRCKLSDVALEEAILHVSNNHSTLALSI